MLKRNWRSGELQLLLLSLILAITCTTSINYFSLAIKQGMGLNASRALGGNLVLISSQKMPQTWLEKAKTLKLNHASALTFLSVLVAGEQYQLASVKAVSSNYPLLGDLKITQGGISKSIKAIPSRNTLWLEPRLFHSLKLLPNQTLNLGSSQFNATHQLSFDPSHGGSLFMISPTALINLDDVAQTKVIQPGSRIKYRWYFTGLPSNIAQFQNWLKDKLSPSERLLTPEKSQGMLKRAFERVDNFLKLSMLISFVLCGTVIALSVRRFLQHHERQIALMRCFGSSYWQILSIHLGVLIGVGFIGITLGATIGYLLQPLLLFLIQDTLKLKLTFYGFGPFLSSYAYGFILLFGFSIPTLRQLRNIESMSLLRDNKNSFIDKSHAQIGTSLMLIIFLSWWQLNDLKLALSVVMSLVVCLLFFAVISYLMISFLFGARKRVGISWRYGLSNLARQSQHAVIQILAFSITFTVILLISLLWRDLSKNWQDQLPWDTPNYFAFNIAPDQVDMIKNEFRDKRVKFSKLYPMVRGRIVRLNGQPILKVLPPRARSNNALHRELNLSWSKVLPPNNAVSEGSWWSLASKIHFISVEKKLAQNLGLNLGDELGFKIGSEELIAKISSFRTVDWTQFTPNFYVLFPNNQLLQRFPQTYITSFFLDENQASFINLLVKKFPNISVVDVADMMKQVRNTVLSFARITGFLNAFILLAGIAIVFASIEATLDKRIEENLLLRVLGASQRQIFWGLISEFIFIGFISGLISFLTANMLAYYVSTELLLIPFNFNFKTIMISLLICPLVVSFFGWISTRVVRNKPLRESINTNEI